MSIDKLEEFARDGQKNTDELILTDGFPKPKFPARQWFNYLFNAISLKINEIIDLDPIARSEIVDNLTTNDATKPLSAKQGKDLQVNKLGRQENAVSASKLEIARKINNVVFDGTKDITIPTQSIIVSTGTIAHGATIPIPSGYTEEQCKWMVSSSATNGALWMGADNRGGNYLEVKCFTTGRVVTSTISFYNTSVSGTYDSPVMANYILIGVK